MKMAVFTNQAKLVYGDRTTFSNIVTGERVNALSITKTAVQDSYGRGNRLTYIVSIKNTGNSAYNGLTLTDDLGRYTLGELALIPLSYDVGSLLYYVNGTLEEALDVTAEPALTANGIDVPAGGNVLVVYTVTANEYAPLDIEGEITNTVTLSGNGIETVSDNETVTAITSPELEITKSLEPVSVVGNGPLTYTFVISNTGSAPVTAETAAVISDVFDPILNITEVTLDGEVLTRPDDYTYNETTGEFATVAGKITIPAAAIAQNPNTGIWSRDPGTVVLKITGTI